MNKKIVVTSNVLPVGEFYTYHENESRDILFIFRREVQKVAKELEDDYKIKLIDSNKDKCKKLSKNLDNSFATNFLPI